MADDSRLFSQCPSPQERPTEKRRTVTHATVRLYEECYFDYSLNPIRGQNGQVEGILNIVQETTYRVLNDRRTRLLRELASLSGSAQHEEDACTFAMASLATDPADLSLCLAVSPGSAQSAGHTRRSRRTETRPSRRARHRGTHDAETARDWLPRAAWRHGTPSSWTTWSTGSACSPEQPGLNPPDRPSSRRSLQSHDEDGGVFLIVGVSPRRQLDGDHRHFWMVASQIAIALTNARAYRSEARRAEAYGVRPGKDGVLQQRQPRVSHSTDAHAGPPWRRSVERPPQYQPGCGPPE